MSALHGAERGAALRCCARGARRDAHSPSSGVWTPLVLIGKGRLLLHGASLATPGHAGSLMPSVWQELGGDWAPTWAMRMSRQGYEEHEFGQGSGAPSWSRSPLSPRLLWQSL